ncbi:MAG: IGHMBP2 family helicase [Halodesulfurarchaeum sp.]
MTELLVRGLDRQGPGDIVGAFAGEADVDPERIGEIDIDGEEATVEVEDAIADELLEEMDGNTVGSSTVSVARFEDVATVREYVDRYSELVEREREAEMERHEREIRQLSGREREAKGRAIRHLEGRDQGEGLGGYEVKFLRQKRDEIPETEIGVGDLVMLSRQDPTREDNPTGTVTEVTNHSVTVAFDGEPPGSVFGDGLRMDLYVNDVTFQRMLDALEALPDADGDLAALRDVLVGERKPATPDQARIEEWFDEDLNDSQKRAVRRAMDAEDFYLIHGPPGTGKTTTAIEVIRQAIDRGESVLATAASNAAVDNLVEFLAAAGVDVVRIGHPARVNPTLRDHTLDARIADNETYQESQELREEAFDLLDEQEDLTSPSGKWRRGLSDERIRDLAEQGRGSRGVPPERIEEMAEWLEIQSEADELFDRAEALEDEAVGEILESADVVCTTNSTAGSDLLEGRTFDRLVIDEATQATEPSCLIPITRARRVVMAGDHRQLPPTVQSEAAARRSVSWGEGDPPAPTTTETEPTGDGGGRADGLRETLFERLAERHGAPIDTLEVQYRMHETIMSFPSAYFYDGQLRAAESVADHTLRDLGVDSADPALEPEPTLTFVDTAGFDAGERQREGSTSRENPREAELVVDYATSLLAEGLPAEELAIISPYDDQVDRIEDDLARAVADHPDLAATAAVEDEAAAVEETTVGVTSVDLDALEVDTVDGFQGREKEVVLVSLVRSNDRGEIGFLADERRFNVAVTRARRKAVIVGDSETVTEGEVFEAMVEYADREGRLLDPARPAA